MEEIIEERIIETTTFVDETTSRFRGAEWFEEVKKQIITIAGLGGIGSYTAFLMSRLKPTKIILYDDDVIEMANMSGQLYGSSHIGLTKVDATTEILRNFSCFYDYISFNEKFTADSEATKIMICGFDNMSARVVFFNKWKNYVLSLSEEERKECLFIDGRLAVEELQVLSFSGIDGEYISIYEREYLFKDEEALQEICSNKQTSYMAMMIGAIITNLFINFVTNLKSGYRSFPFFTNYKGDLISLNILK